MYHNYISTYLDETAKIAQQLSESNLEQINDMIHALKTVRDNKGRVFIVGVGGGSGTGSHAANDFNKIANISCFNLTDNPSLLTALANDEGWDSIFARQLDMHHFNGNDCLFIYSVGGGNAETSPNLVKAIDMARERNAKIMGVVGKDTGHAALHGHAVMVIPNMHDDRVTAHTENWQLIFDHLIVNALTHVVAEADASANEA